MDKFKEEKHGIYVFLIKDCWVCNDYIKELEQNFPKSETWNSIDCDEDLTYIVDELKLDDIPMTRLYDKGVMVWEKSGILYSTQRDELYNKISERLGT